MILEALAVAFATNWLVYFISLASESSAFVFAWVTPVACYLWFRTTHRLSNCRYLVRLGYYVIAVVGALALFGIIQVQIEPPSDWPLTIYLGYLPICALQLVVSSLAAALPATRSTTEVT
jgi:hypothetical protein